MAAIQGILRHTFPVHNEHLLIAAFVNRSKRDRYREILLAEFRKRSPHADAECSGRPLAFTSIGCREPRSARLAGFAAAPLESTITPSHARNT